MDQNEKRLFLIRALLDERPEYARTAIPNDVTGQKRLLRALMNVRLPGRVKEDFLAVQDEYLREEIRRKGVTDLADLHPVKGDLYLWQGDITTLSCDAIVNAANSGLTGCYLPCHGCIDNCIHTFSGVQLRNYCASIMEKQGCEEETGGAKITPAFNLPCRYILHTVGPIVHQTLTERHKALLASCYTSCLKLAEENGCESIAFCCISTGVFGFPQREAAKIAVQTVAEYKRKTGSGLKVVFNVFKDEDLAIYKELLK